MKTLGTRTVGAGQTGHAGNGVLASWQDLRWRWRLETITAVTVDLSADTVGQAGQPALDVRVLPLLAVLSSLLLTRGSSHGCLVVAHSRLGPAAGLAGDGVADQVLVLVLLRGHEVPLEVDVVRVVFAVCPLFVGPVFPGQTGGQ